jgi:hypothetical protein
MGNLDTGGVGGSTKKKRAKASNMVLLSIFVAVEGALLELYVRYKNLGIKRTAAVTLRAFNRGGVGGELLRG